MKKILLIVSAALLLAGCAKEVIGPYGGDGELQEVCFSANLAGEAAKATIDNDGNAAYVNRCVMEIYYGDDLFTRKYSQVNDQKKASFTVQLVSNRTYTVAFWADHVEQTTEAGLQIDNYYDTRSADGLKSVAIKGNYLGNNDARDAFAFCDDFVVVQGGSVFEATLHRPFAQMNVITTDVAIVAQASGLAPNKVNLTLKNAYTAYNVVDAAPVTTAVADLTYTANIYSWDDTKEQCTLSMDYIFADTEKALIDIDWKAKKTGEEDVVHAFAAIPYQKNYRTNVKGALLTTQGQWTVTVNPTWETPDHLINYVVAYNIADANAKMEAGAHYVNVLEPNDAETVNVKIPNTESGDNDFGVAISGVPAGDSKTVRVEELGEQTGTLGLVGPQTATFEINCPNLTVTLNGEEQHDYTAVIAATADNTLIVQKGVTVTDMLTITKGTSYIYGNVADVTLAPVAEAVASVTEWHVYDKAQFLKAIEINASTIVLEEDIALDAAGNFASGTVTLDLNGHTLSRTTTGGTLAERGVVVVNGATLTIIDGAAGGTISGTSNGANNHALTVNSGTCNLRGGILASDYAGVYVLGQGSTNARFNLYDGVINGIYGICVQYSKAKLYMYGGVINANVGITGNGSAERGGTYIDLYGGVINGGDEEGDAGIYHPQSGKLYIQDDLVINGSTAIEMKSGTEYHYSGNPSLEATNSVVSHNPNSNGVSTTGYALVIVNNPDYSGNASASIKNGRHYGPVAILDDDSDPDNNTAKMAITGGIFSIRPADEYLASGYAVIDNTDSQTKDRYPFAIGTDKFIGSGTEDDPYQVSTAADIKKISTYGKTTHFLLMQNLELAKEDLTVSGQYGGKAITSRIYATFDGGGHKITLPKDDGFYMICDRMYGGTIKNLDVEFAEDGVLAFQNYDGMTLQNVNVSGKLLHFTGNQGAYTIYSFDKAVIEDCTCSADITGKGGYGDYNSVFVGYDISGGLPYVFRNCKFTGNMICGRSAMFIGNPNSYVMNLTVENCENAGNMTSTYVDDSYVMNYYYAITSNNYTSFTLNGVEHPGVASAGGQSWVPRCWEDQLVLTSGTAVNGPVDSGMKLVRNADNQFVVTPATNGVISGTAVAKYVVSTGLYVGVPGGSGRFYATEDIVSTGAASYVTTMKDYQFVDRVFVGEGTIVPVGDNNTFTDAAGTYYVIGEGQTISGHGKANAEMYSLDAFDANGKLLGSVSITVE